MDSHVNGTGLDTWVGTPVKVSQSLTAKHHF